MPKDEKNKLITDARYFPRSEYYTRFEDTTAFRMNDSDYFGSYHRSERTRFFTLAGGRCNVEFASPVAAKPENYTAFYAHTGGIASPFSRKHYREAIKADKQVPIGRKNVHDALLLYKRKMANVVVKSFAAECDNEQKVYKPGTKKQYNKRPIVFVENGYPCVMIQFPAVNSLETATGKRWAKNPKPFQKLLIASFIAYLNMEAVNANIPIEIVLRASFGHNQPSICETDGTFRINVGVIPKKYAELIGKALFKLNKEIAKIEEENSTPAKFSAEFRKDLREYNAKKLKIAIDKYDRYETLKGSRDYKTAGQSNEAFNRLYKAFCEKNQVKSTAKKAKFVPVCLNKNMLWDLLSERANTRGDTLLRECFHENRTVDWFGNAVMEGLEKGEESPILYALEKLLNLLRYQNTVTMDYNKIDNDLKKKKRAFKSDSFKRIYGEDKEFSQIVGMLFAAFNAKKKDQSIYAALEYAGYEFFSHAKGSATVEETCDYGSSSQYSEDITLDDSESEDYSIFDDSQFDAVSTCDDSKPEDECESGEREIDDELPLNGETSSSKSKKHSSHAKLRVCSGMKAILLAQYGALFHLKEQGENFYSKDTAQMYYEVEDALKTVKYDKMTERSKHQKHILQYDLNHCNASNSSDNKSLAEKLEACNPTVVILDYTSSTYTEIDEALKQCFSRSNVNLVIMVQSGLKNEQGGYDFNPYGEVRVLARDRKTCNSIIEQMEKGLSIKDRLYPEAHELVRACKRTGLAMSFYGHRQTKSARFKEIIQTSSMTYSR